METGWVYEPTETPSRTDLGMVTGRCGCCGGYGYHPSGAPGYCGGVFDGLPGDGVYSCEFCAETGYICLDSDEDGEW